MKLQRQYPSEAALLSSPDPSRRRWAASEDAAGGGLERRRGRRQESEASLNLDFETTEAEQAHPLQKTGEQIEMQYR